MTTMQMALTLLAVFGAAPAMADTVIIREGSNGTAVISRGCGRGAHGVTCDAMRSATGAQNATATKDVQRTLAPGQLQASVTITGPRGNAVVRERSTDWAREEGLNATVTRTGPEGRSRTISRSRSR